MVDSLFTLRKSSLVGATTEDAVDAVRSSDLGLGGGDRGFVTGASSVFSMLDVETAMPLILRYMSS